ncbi:MAG: TetR/AcrR family transcriptional regulator [Nevskia sp.]|jgi:AcrR family transcriptional regulator|nr:TetR/AcrR family transcriptional regulator [Nevskia sp.]
MPRKPASPQFDALQALKERAFELFGRYGYDGVSIADLAQATGLSKGALYWHYSGKQALYLDCLKQLHALFEHYIFGPMKAQDDPGRAILTMFEGLERLSHDPRVEKGIAGYWLVPSGPETAPFAAEQRAFERASMQVIATVLERGVRQGRFDLAGDLEDFARAVILLVEVAVLPLRHQSPQDVRRVLGVLARTLFRAYARESVPPSS